MVNPALRGSVPFSLVHSQLLVTVKIGESSPGMNWSGAVQDGVSVSVFFFSGICDFVTPNMALKRAVLFKKWEFRVFSVVAQLLLKGFAGG